MKLLQLILWRGIYFDTHLPKWFASNSTRKFFIINKNFF